MTLVLGVLAFLGFGMVPNAAAQPLEQVYGAAPPEVDGEGGFNFDHHKCVLASCLNAILVNAGPGGVGAAGCTWDGINPGGSCTGSCQQCTGTITTNVCVKNSSETCTVGGGTFVSCGTINTIPRIFSTTTAYERPCGCSGTVSTTLNPCNIGRCS
ncbi:MAG: hypothetical protein ACKVW3_09865 [Phycisphaerales bacterium]